MSGKRGRGSGRGTGRGRGRPKGSTRANSQQTSAVNVVNGKRHRRPKQMEGYVVDSAVRAVAAETGPPPSVARNSSEATAITSRHEDNEPPVLDNQSEVVDNGSDQMEVWLPIEQVLVQPMTANLINEQPSVAIQSAKRAEQLIQEIKEYFGSSEKTMFHVAIFNLLKNNLADARRTKEAFVECYRELFELVLDGRVRTGRPDSDPTDGRRQSVTPVPYVPQLNGFNLLD